MRYDLLLTQNTASSGIEFEEKSVRLSKASILTGTGAVDDEGNPVALTAAVGDIGKVLKVVDAGTDDPKLEFAEHKSHDQNTDIGTDSMTFYVGGGTKGAVIRKKPHLEAEAPAEALEIMNWEKSTLIPVEASSGVFSTSAFAGTHAEPFLPLPTNNNHALTTKKYVDDSISAGFAANDAMMFKGVLTNSPANNGTITSEDTTNVNGKNFGQLANYSAGWVIKVGVAIADHENFGKLDANDTIIAKSDASGTEGAFNAADWFVIQGNVDAANLVLKTDFGNAFSILAANTDNVPLPITADADQVLLRDTNLKFAKIKDANIDANAGIGLSKLTKLAQSKLIGTDSFGTGEENIQALSIGTGLEIDDGFLKATNAGTVTSVTATSPVHSTGGATPVISLVTGTDSVGIALATHMRHIATKTIVGNSSGSTAAPAALTPAEANEVLHSAAVPASPTAAGTKGQIAYDDNFVYRCIHTGTVGNAKWRRFPMSVWEAA